MRAHLLVVMIASGCGVTAATACSSPDVALEANARKATQASSVSVSMFDKAGNALGSCSGTLLSKDVVLTAGHCVAGAAKWTVDSRGADATSDATHAVTPWKAFGSDLSHPDHSDVGLILLDKPIELESYPAIATSKLADGAKALRFSRASAAAGEAASSEVAVSGMGKKGFRLNYAAKIEKSSFLDTGGAVVDAKTGKIHGVVSGVGNESGLLHIARVDNFAKWITRAMSCMGSSSLGVRTYGTSSGGSSSWGGGGSSSWGGGSGDWGGYGGSGDKIDGGGSVPGAGMDGGAGSSGTSGTSSGGGTAGSSGSAGTPGSSSGSSGTTGSSGSAGDGDTSGSGSSCPGVPTCEGSDCPGVPGGGGSSGSSGSDGANGGSSGSSGTTSGGTSGSSGTTSGSSGSSGSDGTNAGGDEVCPGPPSCPEPDSQSCTGAACGGCGGVSGCVDATIDYGNCASCGGSNGTGTPPVVR